MQVVEKFGGTSMARPDVVLERIREQHNPAALVVVSAAGIDVEGGYDVGVTNQLIRLREQPNNELESEIVARQGAMASRHIHDTAGRSFETQARADIREFRERNWPLEALGELWSARLLAEMSGLALLDPRDNIFFDQAGQLVVNRSIKAIRHNVQPGRQAIMGGFVGRHPNGDVCVLPRGGSDTSGAVAALALAPQGQYRNWSDVSGFRTSDPRDVNDTLALDELNYLESREFGINGCKLLHPQVPALLGHSAVTTVMCHTWSGEHGTMITRERDWAKSPIVGVSTSLNLLRVTLNAYGMNEAPGQTTGLFRELAFFGVAYKDSATNIDTVMVTVDGSDGDKLKKLQQRVGLSELSVHELSAVHVIGQGLVDPCIRMRTLAECSSALYDAGVGSRGDTDAGGSPGMTFFVAPDELALARDAAHKVIRRRLIAVV